jgi:hypothetical protein
MPSLAKTPQSSADIELADEIAGYYDDLHGAVLFLYPWQESGTPLEHMRGPSREQARFLDDLSDEVKARAFNGIDAVESIEMAVTSGHGGGKTELIGMLAGALMSTRPGMHGTVTANNGQQLRDKTWASIQKYKKLLVNSHWFDITSEKFWRIGSKEDWFFSAVTWKEENADAFQGQHAARSSSIYIFDEDSNVPDSIHTAAEGGTIHGESMIFRFGNCTRRDGNFYHRCFGTRREALIRKTLGPSKGTSHPASLRRWDTSQTEIRSDSKLREWLEEYGEDSDFWRVRVQGLPPNAGDLQFIGADLIARGQKANPHAMPDDALVAGCDLSWGGSDPICIRFVRGMDWRSISPIKIPGAQTRDEGLVTTKLIDVLTREWNGRKVALLAIDSAGSCGNICRRLRELGHTNIIEVNFGGHSPNAKYKLMRSYMWGLTKEGLSKGAAIDISPDLEADLGAVGHTITRQTEILLEEKQKVIKRLGHSTDDGDALGLANYAATLVPSLQKKNQERERYVRYRSQGRVGAWS